MFESMIQQVVQESFASSATNLIIAITGLVAAISVGVGTIAGYLKTKGIANKGLDYAIKGGQIAQMANQKAVEAKDRISTGLDAFYQLAPEEQKEVLKNALPNLNKLTEEVTIGNAQVDRINSILPEFQAKKLDVPREPFETKPDSDAVKT